ncbi:MAG: hypothetical protein LBH56_03355 [Coriobacteriales bacterium]|jgi:acetyl-CoA carboxylase biotin carboxyl carrier protein|nr:hypothetical protein [Coriobacteriales bacterium]
MTPDLEQLASLLNAHDLSRLEYAQGDLRVVMERQTLRLSGTQLDTRLGAMPPGAPTGAPAGEPCATGEQPSSSTPYRPAANPNSAAVSPAATTSLITVTTPLVGVAYRSREPGAPPLVECGQRVVEGEVLCLIEAMKLFNEITAPAAGVVEAILFQDGCLAEYGAPLITLVPDDAPAVDGGAEGAAGSAAALSAGLAAPSAAPSTAP